MSDQMEKWENAYSRGLLVAAVVCLIVTILMVVGHRRPPVLSAPLFGCAIACASVGLLIRYSR